jgi:hypothetical protein
MTNFLTDIDVPFNYLLGLLNSSLLNWRIKLTSTNNYLSAAEILALPIPRPRQVDILNRELTYAREKFNDLAANPPETVDGCVNRAKQALGNLQEDPVPGLLAKMVEWTAESIVDDCFRGNSGLNRDLCRLLDAVVLLLYGVEQWSVVVEK